MEMGINKYSAYDVVNTLDKKYLGNNKNFRRRKRWKNNCKQN